MIAVGGRQLDDVPPDVGRARVGRIDSVILALGIVRQHDVDLAADRVRLDILRTVHWCRTEQRCRAPCLDDDIGLAVKAVFRGQGSVTVHQRQPGQRTIVVEAGHRQRAAVKQVAVGFPVVRVDAILGDEAVEILEALVIARIQDQATVAVDD